MPVHSLAYTPQFSMFWGYQAVLHKAQNCKKCSIGMAMLHVLQEGVVKEIEVLECGKFV